MAIKVRSGNLYTDAPEKLKAAKKAYFQAVEKVNQTRERMFREKTMKAIAEAINCELICTDEQMQKIAQRVFDNLRHKQMLVEPPLYP